MRASFGSAFIFDSATEALMQGVGQFPRSLWRRLKRQISYANCVREMNRRWHSGVAQSPHPLPGQLIVSLTSYPPRFATLDKTIKCLLRQTVKPDAIVLWIASGDRSKLPDAVTRLERDGLTIACCDNLRSYKKIIPALERYPNAFIVAADDDLYIWPTWLE